MNTQRREEGKVIHVCKLPTYVCHHFSPKNQRNREENQTSIPTSQRERVSLSAQGPRHVCQAFILPNVLTNSLSCECGVVSRLTDGTFVDEAAGALLLAAEPRLQRVVALLLQQVVAPHPPLVAAQRLSPAVARPQTHSQVVVPQQNQLQVAGRQQNHHQAAAPPLLLAGLCTHQAVSAVAHPPRRRG